MSYNTEKFNDQFMKLPIYQKFPQMMPFVGSDYGKMTNRLLVIGESHYLPNVITVHHDDNKWYNDPNFVNQALIELGEEEEIEIEKWIDNSRPINDGKYRNYESKEGKKSRSNTIFRNIELAIIESGFKNEACENLFQYISYYNYFQRPAEVQGGSINNSELDNKMAIEHFFKIIDIIKPNYVIFTSSKAWNAFKSTKSVLPNESDDYVFNDDVVIENTPHPANPWWNKPSRKYGNRTGKQSFIHTLQHYKIFQ